jgi:hypothetical protein
MKTEEVGIDVGSIRAGDQIDRWRGEVCHRMTVASVEETSRHVLVKYEPVPGVRTFEGSSFRHGERVTVRREQLADGPRCLVCGYCIEGSESHAVCMACQDWSAAFQCPYTGEGIQATYKPGDLLSDNALWLEMESDPSEAHPDTRGYLAEFAEKAGGVYFANCGTVRVVVEDGDEARALLLKHGDVTERDLA